MNEFDLRKFLYNNPLMEKKEDSKKGNKEEQKRMEGAIRDDRDHIKDLEKDIEDNEKKLAKLKKDFKKDVNEEMSDPVMRKGLKGDDKEEKRTEKMREEEDKKLTKEGLKNMIREKITSILNEEDIDESDARTYRGDSYNERGVGVVDQPKSTSTADRQAYIDRMKNSGGVSAFGEELYEDEEDNVDVDIEKDVDVKDKEDVDVDVEKDVEVDDVSKETDIDVKTSLPGESEDVDAVLGLLTKASEEADRFGDDPELKTQIGNTITYFTRKHVAKS